MPISSASRPRSPAQAGKPAKPGGNAQRDHQGGFAMLDVVLALVILSLLAALGLPFVRPQAGATALRAKAFDIVALLRAERNAALRSGMAVTVFVDARHGRIRSGRTGREIVMAPPMSLQLLPSDADGITFFPNGRAAEAEIALRNRATAVRIAVSGPTAMISLPDAGLATR